MRLFVERLSRSIERASQYPGFHFAVLRVALDRPGGGAERPGGDDVLLSTAARRLEASLRVREMPPTLRHDDVVARLDGDGFAILLDGLKDVAHATVVAERILAGMLEPFTVDGREERLVACVGVAAQRHRLRRRPTTCSTTPTPRCSAPACSAAAAARCSTPRC